MIIDGIEVKETENGNLLLTADIVARGEIADRLEDNGFWFTLFDALEGYSTNGSYTPFNAGDGNPFVGLTDAPCIAEELDYLDDGTCEIVGQFWYFNNYMIECPLETLAETGQVVFSKP